MPRLPNELPTGPIELLIKARIDAIIAESGTIPPKRLCCGCGNEIPYEGQTVSVWQNIQRCVSCGKKPIPRETLKFCGRCAIPFSFAEVEAREKASGIASIERNFSMLEEAHAMALAEPNFNLWWQQIVPKGVEKGLHLLAHASIMDKFAFLRKTASVSEMRTSYLKELDERLKNGEGLAQNWGTARLCNVCVEQPIEGDAAFSKLAGAIKRDPELARLRQALK